jgi:hypothetical protein
MVDLINDMLNVHYNAAKFTYICIMITYRVDILNPKATKLLQDLADLDFISIKQATEDNFLSTINRIRSKATGNTPSLEDITKEVESVRAKRYAKNKG